MSRLTVGTLSQRERELAAIISAYNEVTDQLKQSHERLNEEVYKLRVELEQKNVELARRQRLAALGEMATGVAHEIRNPLGSIRLYASLLDRDLEVLPQSQQLIRKISAGVTALDKIVGDILDFAGRGDPDSVQVSLQELLCNVVEVACGAALAGGVRLELDPVVGEYEVWVDRGQIERAVLNVVLNGIEASEESSVVCISADSAEGDFVALSISDGGPGIDEAIQEKIFNPFFTTKETGTGLGLAIVHRIVESHGGWVRVCNSPSGGACFTLHLPTDARGATGNKKKERPDGADMRG